MGGYWIYFESRMERIHDGLEHRVSETGCEEGEILVLKMLVNELLRATPSKCSPRLVLVCTGRLTLEVKSIGLAKNLFAKNRKKCMVTLLPQSSVTRERLPS